MKILRKGQLLWKLLREIYDIYIDIEKIKMHVVVVISKNESTVQFLLHAVEK